MTRCAVNVGADVRHDAIGKVGLFLSVDGIPVDPVRVDVIEQSGFGLFADGQIAITPTFRGFLGLRHDYQVDPLSGDPAERVAAPEVTKNGEPQRRYNAVHRHGERPILALTEPGDF